MNIFKNQLNVEVNIPYMNPIGYRSDLITRSMDPFFWDHVLPQERHVFASRIRF